ncbi:OmpA family protein [Mucilaginibacter phyllosphaerae]
MNFKIIKCCFLLLLSASSTRGISQTLADTSKQLLTKKLRTWSAGVNGGILTHWTPFNRATNGDYATPHQKLGYAFFVKNQLLSDLGLQADFLFGKVRGSKLGNFPVGMTGQDQSGYEMQINWSADLRAYFTIPNLSLSIKTSPIVPYLTAGAGYISYSTTVYNAPGANSGDGKSWFLPIGIGFKVGVSRVVNIDLGYTVYSVRTNSFDGYKSGLHDHFSYAHLGVEYNFGKKNARQLHNYSTVADVNQEVNGVKKVNAEVQAKLAAAEQERLKNVREMADDDNDGVANRYDKCPATPVNTPVDGAGCPLPIVKEKVVITQQDRRVIGEAINNLEFEYGKANIKEKSYETLNQVADLLVKKDFSLKLAGHTDNKGRISANLKLSKARAESVKAYLVSHGANASRIEATGYGYTQPIATNKTAKGRSLNRRVEFTLF